MGIRIRIRIEIRISYNWNKFSKFQSTSLLHENFVSFGKKKRKKRIYFIL